jgi:glycosyltransferase involved in cell wall biosynthesis
MLQFSVVMSVYRNDNPEFVVRAIESITTQQRLKPNEVVLVVDGPIPNELGDLVRSYEKLALFNVIWLPENRGLGNALRIGVESAKYDVFARMDSDDIALPDRFEKQISYLLKYPNCDIVGGQMTEFIGQEDNIVGARVVPCSHEEIVMWLKGRCPFNHMTVTALRSRVIAVGNYKDWHFNEDYYLWIRMAEAGCTFANLPDILVNVRVGKEMYARRGGWKYFKSEKGLQTYMLKHGIISWPRYIVNVIIRFIVQVALPNRVRGLFFQKLFRKR